MFPELMQDEVFRVETARFWLRWPTAAELAADGSFSLQRGMDGVICAEPSATARLLTRWYAENSTGQSMNLLVTPKADPATAVGYLRIAPGPEGEPALEFGLDEMWRGHGVVAETARMLIDVVFRVTALPGLVALPTRLSQCGRRTLEGLGFVFSGRQRDETDRFELDRAIWRQDSDGFAFRRSLTTGEPILAQYA